MLYFAYGSNMPSSQMQRRCPGASFAGIARLQGHRLAFDRRSDRRRGFVADVVADPAAEVWGVLWEITDAHAVSLDGYEGVAVGQYRRITVEVERTGGERVRALAYQVCEPEPPGPPPRAYLDLLVEGAREHGLPTGYVGALEGVEAAKDPGR